MNPSLPSSQPSLRKYRYQHVQKWTDVERQTRPDVLEPPRPVVGRPEDRAEADERAAGGRQLLLRLQHRVAIVLGRPVRDPRLVAVVLDQIALQLLHPAGDVEVMVHQIRVVDRQRAAPEELQQVLRVVAAVLDPASAEHLAPAEVVAVGRGRRQRGADRLAKLRREPLIGVEGQDPLGRDRQFLEGPAPLARVRVEGMPRDVRVELPRDHQRRVRTSRNPRRTRRSPSQ